MTAARKRAIVDEDSKIRPARASRKLDPPDEPTLTADEQDVIPQSTGPLTAVEAVAGAAAGAALGAIAGPAGIAAGAAIGGAVGAALGVIDADRSKEEARIDAVLDEEIGVTGGAIGHPQTNIEPEIGAPSAASAGVGTTERSYPEGGPREAPDTGVGGDTR
jgi:hypothetical protein